MIKRDDINIRDPYIVVEDNQYYMFGTTDFTRCEKANSFLCYTSKDLENFEEPIEAFVPEHGFWADINYWAPEVHKYNGKYYMFASFKAENICRATLILVSDTIKGPYKVLSDKARTPKDMECLDGTLWVENGKPYMIFCNEWLQVYDGTMYAIELSEDLTETIGEPVLLFYASSAKWTTGINSNDKINYITDGPFIYKNKKDELIMLWSSFGNEGYCIGQAISRNGLLGPWIQIDEPIFLKDGGHGMIFESLDGKLLLSIHLPNSPFKERANFIEIEEKDGLIHRI